jgi:uncharacterized FlaG/YvyC family protein
MANVISSIGYGVSAPAPTAAAATVVPHASAPALPVTAVRPPEPVQPAATGGNGAPSGGQSLPAAATTPAAQGDLIQLQAVVQGVNQFLRNSQRQIVFQFDPQNDKEQVTIVNPATGEVIRQIPAVQVLSTAQNLQQAGDLMTGLILDESA